MGKTYIETIKYMIHANFEIEGLVERPDVIGAIFGQSEGLLGPKLDIKELQQNGKIGRIEITVRHGNNKTSGELKLPCSLSMVETSVIAAAIETIEKVGPCDSRFKVKQIEDTRELKRKHIKDRAIDLLGKMLHEQIPDTRELMEDIMETFKTKEIVNYGPDKLPAGPAVDSSKELIIVEGRADILNLLKYGFTNTISTGGARIPRSLAKICKSKIVTLFLDGDHGGDIQLSQLLKNIKVDYIARAPDGKEVEELTQKEINQALRKKIKASIVAKVKDNKLQDGLVKQTKFSTTNHNKFKINIPDSKKLNYREIESHNIHRHTDKEINHPDNSFGHMLSGISNVERVDLNTQNRRSFNNRNDRNQSHYRSTNRNRFNSSSRPKRDYVKEPVRVVPKLDDKKGQNEKNQEGIKTEGSLNTLKSKKEKDIKKEPLPKLTANLKKSFLNLIKDTKDNKGSRILNEKLRRIGGYSSSNFLNKLKGFKPNKIYAIITDLEANEELLKIAKEKNVKFIVSPSSKIKEDKNINIVTHEMLK